jgi:hypothetical protein
MHIIAVVGLLFIAVVILAGRFEASLCCPKVEVRFAVKDLATEAQKCRTPAVDAQLVEVALADV